MNNDTIKELKDLLKDKQKMHQFIDAIMYTTVKNKLMIDVKLPLAAYDFPKVFAPYVASFEAFIAPVEIVCHTPTTLAAILNTSADKVAQFCAEFLD